MKETQTAQGRPDFTRQMKKEYTIVAPDIFPIHMKLVREIFLIYGYRLEVVRYSGKEVIDTGLKYLHNDVCYPAICTVGQQLYALTCGDFDPDKTALIQFQTGGGCRASNYIFLLRKALHEMGMDHVPVLSLSFTGLEKYSGFTITPSMVIAAARSLVYGDLLMLLKNRVEPYERDAGAAERLTDKWVAELRGQFSRRRGITEGAMKKNLAAIAADFAALPRVNRRRTKVGIVGEIYVKYSPLGNNGLEKFLLSQGCEIMVPGVLGFFDYCFSNIETDAKYYGGSPLAVAGGKALLRMSAKWEKDIADALAPYPDFPAPLSFDGIRRLADRVIDRGVKMGEGWLLPGEVCELIEKGYGNIICAQPFGCLPNHIVGKGTIKRLRELYPDANIFPIDYDSGASKVNQENRIKLMLAMAAEKEKEKQSGTENEATEAIHKASAERTETAVPASEAEVSNL